MGKLPVVMDTTLAAYGLYGEKYEPRLPDFVHSELHETRCKQYGWVISPHIHTNLVQIVLIESGEAAFTAGSQTISLKEPCLITMPVDVLHGYVFSSDVKGVVISLADTYPEELFRNSPSVRLALGRMQLVRAGQDPEMFWRIAALAWQVHRELYANLPERMVSIQACLSLLLVNVYRLVHRQAADAMAVDNRNLQYFRQFQQLLKENGLNRLTITDYARMMGITAVHLNRICRTIVGKSTLQTIQEAIILEAQRYLHHSSYSISEIAYLLNFEDVSYFSRLFKKQLGLSPRQFREQAARAIVAGKQASGPL